VFAVYQRWGVAGIKFGFMPSGSQLNERTIAALVRLAAAHRLLVNIHDAYLPSGLSRTYPNLVNVEGVAGEFSLQEVLDKLAEASLSPSGLKARSHMGEGSALVVRIGSPVVASHNPMCFANPPAAIRLPSGLKATAT
jgi:hypothetical protein